MIQTPIFWQKEVTAPLMNLNFDFLKPELNEDVLQRTAAWSSLLISKPEATENTKKPDLSKENPDNRVLIHDAERTFVAEENRHKLFRILATLQQQFGDYAQGLSYATSFLLLTLEEEPVMEILTALNSQEQYIPGYWKAQAVSFAKDAFVFQSLMQSHFPEVAAHLQKNVILPHTYCQKWFVGLCLHVLPFEALFSFWEQFIQGGYQFLMKFGLALIKNIKDELLATNESPKLFGLLRLDQKILKADLRTTALQITEDAKTFDVSGVDFKTLRDEMYEKHLKASLERKPVEDSDEESTEFDSEDDDEDGGECQICTNMMPDYFCETCDKRICEMCHNKSRGTHKKAEHKVKPFSE